MTALAALPASLPRPSSGAASGPTGVFWGAMAVGLTPHRHADSPWRLSNEDYAEPSFPTFAFGVGYLLDRPLALYVAAHAEKLRLLPLEDVSAGLWVDAAKADGYNVIYASAGGVTNFRSDDCGSMVITHYVPPASYRCMWANYYAKQVRLYLDLGTDF